jgi:hypothetical protein
MENQSKGVIYIATGKKYLDEAVRSATSLKRHMPNMPITLFSSEEIDSSLFERVIKIEDPKYGFADLTSNYYKSPYVRTLFLDTDTYVCGDFSELFDLLDFFDIGLSHVPNKNGGKFGIPSCFVGFNTGVILFKKSEKMNKFFLDWRNMYLQTFEERKKNVSDKRGPAEQPIFLKMIYKTNLRIVTLSEKYNFRTRWGYLAGKVKIMHLARKLIGKNGKRYELINKKINSINKPRGYIIKKNSIYVSEFSKKKQEFISGNFFVKGIGKIKRLFF